MIPNVLNPWDVAPEDLEPGRRDALTRELISGLMRGEFSLLTPEPGEDPEWTRRSAEARQTARVLGAGSRDRLSAAAILRTCGATLRELSGETELRELSGAQPWKALSIELISFTNSAVSPWANDHRLLALIWRAAGPDVRAAARGEALNTPLFASIRPRRRQRRSRKTP